MGANNLCDGGMVGQPGLYLGEKTMSAVHLPRLMDSSSAYGFLNHEVPNTNWMGAQYAQNQYQTSLNASYESQLVEEVPLTLEDLSWHNAQQDLCRPFRPHPRVGVFGSLLQQEIANLAKNCVYGRPVEGQERGERPHRAPKTGGPPKTASPVVRPRRAAASPSAVKLVVEQNPPLSWRLLELVS